MTEAIRISLTSLLRFLERKGWRLSGIEGTLETWQPPADLSFPLDYLLRVPSSDETDGGALASSRVAAILADIYELSYEDLAVQGGDSHAILSLRMKSPDFVTGSIPFRSFEGMVDKLRKTLLHTASFVVTQTPTVEAIPHEAQDYLTKCRFLQTAVGSYIARVQLPERNALIEPTLFDEGVDSKVVTDALIDALTFVTARVFQNDRSLYTDEVMEEEASGINVDVFRDIGELLQKSGAESVDFTIASSTGIQTIPTGPLSAARFGHLETFIAFARERLAADREVDVTGRIVELRSRRPDRRRNHVGMAAILDDAEVFISLSMSKQDYSHAVMAHNRNRMVRLRAAVRRMKTQLRVIRLDSFEELQASAEGAPEQPGR